MELANFGVLAATSFIAALALSHVVRWFAKTRRLVDVPNERSLHKAPTPRLGGVAVVVTTTGIVVASEICGISAGSRDLYVWLLGAIGIAVLGLMDDVRSLPAMLRFATQIAIAATVLALTLDGNPTLVDGWKISVGKTPMIAIATIYVVGATNIYNFMDGMDGLAGTQAMGSALALSSVAVITGNLDIAVATLAIAAASGGFLVHNAPPADLFLGDAGSTFFGFSFSTLGLILAVRPSSVPLIVSVVALSPFLLDGTFTIIRRLARGEVIWHAHRSHLYQRAVATGLSHREVLMVYSAWVALAFACGTRLVTGTLTAVLVVTGIMLACLIVVWSWVISRERRAS